MSAIFFAVLWGATMAIPTNLSWLLMTLKTSIRNN